jgi:hypothetical protein
MELIRDRAIGRPYLGRAWYANAREPIGNGEVAPVPEWLDQRNGHIIGDPMAMEMWSRDYAPGWEMVV